MREPVWLTRHMVRVIHFDHMRRHGGQRGVRDTDALESLLARPRARWARDPGCSLLALAASYAHGLMRLHPFNDGNERTAFMLLYVFLGLNGLDFNAAEADVVRQMRLLSERRLSEDALEEWIRTS